MTAIPQDSNTHGLAAAEFARLALHLASQASRDDALREIAAHAAETVPGADAAGITLSRGEGGYSTVAATSELVSRIDDLQYALREGPCLSAIAEQRMIRTNVLPEDERWPRFAVKATETGVVGMLSQTLFVQDGPVSAALNLYSMQADAFDDASASALNIFATHAGIALARVSEHEESEHLKRALASNRTIGMALGILMATYKVTAQEAFDLMRMVSQNRHVKLASLALEVIDTGMIELP